MLAFPQARRAALTLLVLMLLAGAWTHYFVVPKDDRPESDIHYDYLEARRVVAGENPYERILSGDMRTNKKYATYFPLFYLLSAGVVKLGLQEFEQFVAFWRLAFLVFNAGAGAILFYLLWPRRGLLLAVFGVLFWFFSRWNLHATVAASIDYSAVFFLLLAFWLLPRHRVWAFLALGLSLGFKHLDVILVPLFLIVVWQSERQHRIRAVLVASAALASILVAIAAPFLAADPEAFLKAMMFNVVRDSGSPAPSLGMLLNLSGAASRLPFFTLIAMVYALFWRRKIGFYTAGLLAMAAFINFNPVLFKQYFVYLIPLFPLAASEAFPGSKVALAADRYSPRFRPGQGMARFASTLGCTIDEPPWPLPWSSREHGRTTSSCHEMSTLRALSTTITWRPGGSSQARIRTSGSCRATCGPIRSTPPISRYSICSRPASSNLAYRSSSSSWLSGG